MNEILELDQKRYGGGSAPRFQKYMRKCQASTNKLSYLFNKIMFKFFKHNKCIEISDVTKIGEGLYIGHPFAITINPGAIIGKNCNIHKGVTIGQENRGRRKGTPVIGDRVWIGINSTIVGNVVIGDDVLIAPNTYVNCDIESHSVVFGNPCIIKHRDNATEGYVNRCV